MTATSGIGDLPPGADHPKSALSRISKPRPQVVSPCPLPSVTGGGDFRTVSNREQQYNTSRTAFSVIPLQAVETILAVVRLRRPTPYCWRYLGVQSSDRVLKTAPDLSSFGRGDILRIVTLLVHLLLRL